MKTRKCKYISSDWEKILDKYPNYLPLKEEQRVLEFFDEYNKRIEFLHKMGIVTSFTPPINSKSLITNTIFDESNYV